MSVRRLDLSRQGERLQIYLDGLTESTGQTARRECSRCGASSRHNSRYGTTNAHSSSLTSLPILRMGQLVLQGLFAMFLNATGRTLHSCRAKSWRRFGRLANSIAHEINNPLESVTNLLYLSCRSTGPCDDSRLPRERRTRIMVCIGDCESNVAFL
jgi:hypothetical protein